jgi:hypothetical protein
MAVQNKDLLAEIIGTDVVSDRVDSFVWIAATQKYFDLRTFNSSTNKNELRTTLAERLYQDYSEAQKIRQAIKESFIPENEIKWITGNKRQTDWLVKYIYNHNPPAQSLFSLQPPTFKSFTSATKFLIPEFLTDRSRGIAIFDFWSAYFLPSFDYSVGQSKIMHSGWATQEQIEKKFDWFNNEDGTNKRDIFQKILASKKILGIFGNPTILDHDDFLIYLDNLNISDFEKEIISKKTRDRWNQQKRRAENKDAEKQCNFNLSLVIDEKLTKLAKKYELSRVDVIDILIRSEAKHESYIKAWLQRKPSENPVE